MPCKFPGCKFHAEKNDYCIRHSFMTGSSVAKSATEKQKVKLKPTKTVKVKARKPRKAIAKVAQKRKKVNRIYKKIVAEMIGKDPECQIKSPVCTRQAQGLNHKQKRSPNNLTKKSNLEGACNACNGYCEQHPQWARDNGHEVSRFKK